MIMILINMMQCQCVDYILHVEHAVSVAAVDDDVQVERTVMEEAFPVNYDFFQVIFLCSNCPIFFLSSFPSVLFPLVTCLLVLLTCSFLCWNPL